MDQRYKKGLLRFACAVIVLSTLCCFPGHKPVQMILPLISYGIEHGGSGKYEVLEAKVLKKDNIEQILYTIRTHEPFTDQEGKAWPASDQTVGIHAYIVYICPIIVFSMLLSYTNLPGKRKLLAALAAILLLIPVVTIDISTNLLFSLKESYALISPPYQVKLQWYHEFASLFLNTGGRQFLALLVFILSIAPFHMHIEIPRLSSGSRERKLKQRRPVRMKRTGMKMAGWQIRD